MFPTKENVAKGRLNLSKKAFEPYNISRLGNVLIENFVLEREINALKIMIYLAKVDVDIDIEKPLGFKKENSDLINFNICFHELCSYCNLDESTIRKNLKKIDSARLRIYKPEEEFARSIAIFTDIKIYGSKMQIEMKKEIFNELKKTLKDIKEKGFTQIKFVDRLMNLKSFNAFRMFILLNRIRDFKYQNKTLSLEELNGYFGLNYKTFKSLNQKVLKPLEEEFQNIIPFSYEPVYGINPGKGRKPLVGYKINYKAPDKIVAGENLIEDNLVESGEDIVNMIDELVELNQNKSPLQNAIANQRVNNENN